MKKRGLSDVVTTVLIILLAIASVAIIWVVINKTILNSSSQMDISAFSVSLEVQPSSVYIDQVSKAVIFNVKRNSGEGNVIGVNVIVEDSTGKSKVFRIDYPEEFKEFETKMINVVAPDLGQIEKVSVVPIIKSSSSKEISGKSSLPLKISSTQQLALKSCLDILNRRFSRGDTLYWIDPDGTGSLSAVQVYCDMTTDGGGWTLVAVCKSSDNAQNCWNINSVGTINNPDSTNSAKLSDVNIIAILSNGEKTTRTFWRQKTRYTQSFSDMGPASAAVFNKITNPTLWSSSGCGASGNAQREFYTKTSLSNDFNANMKSLSSNAYSSSWSSTITPTDTGCSCAVNGWSNTRQDSCGSQGTWFASCEYGPSMSHLCANNIAERADLIVWAR